ncbi:Uncharacterized protein BM_BM14761 [Brugia malayi]|uniref:Bm14761, isoform a n=3 Tax=Brugia TaxID=6278 RepID=A0A0H5S5K2_BRUMA|nr:Uncharacterized protein BM_BM14761 [Brugia malayi]CRZ23462.1 Bm14761, isoform a [Brugia malayi]VIO87340.1 Uncharacterized protein BM_BM14761 [Brugia malayi]
MSGSGIFWRVYGLLLEKSLMDDMDLEMVEEYYLKSEGKSLISSRSVSCFSIISVVIASGFCASYHVLGLLVCPALFIGLLETTKWFCYYVVSSYINISADFNAVFHRIIATIRSREVAFFGLRKKFDMNATLCLRSLRLELLKALRCDVQCHVHMSKTLHKCGDSEKLFCEMFTFELSRLALEGDIYEEFLQLSALKELWQLLFLVRSEYLRLFLLHLSRPSHRLIRIVLNLFHETLLLRNIKTRLVCSLEFINFRNCCVAENNIRKFSPFLSTTEKILAHIGFASEILSSDEIPEEKKFLFVTETLKKAIEFCAVEAHIEQEDTNHSNMSSNSSISGGTDEPQSSADEMPVEKVYEGFPLVSEDKQKDIFLPSWQESDSNEAVARSVVIELKSRLVERIKELDTAKTAEIDHAQGMATAEDGFREITATDGSYDAERNEFNFFSSVSKSIGRLQSPVKLDLKQAISFIKSAPSVDFIDDAGNES